jgi:hypothetical protein
VGCRGLQRRPASAHSRAGAPHGAGSLKALRLQPAPALSRLSPRPRDPLIGGCGEGEVPHAGAPYGTDTWSPSGAQSRRLGCGSHLTAAAGAAVGTPGGRIAPPGLSPTARICGGPAGGAPVTARGGSGRPAFSPQPAAPGGDVHQHVHVYNSCASAHWQSLKTRAFFHRGAGAWSMRWSVTYTQRRLTPGPVPTAHLPLAPRRSACCQLSPALRPSCRDATTTSRDARIHV